jgi:AraC-like DNA-binding protein
MSWQGEFHFGEWWGAFRGAAGDNHPHAHASLQICLAHQKDVILTDAEGRPLTGRALIVPPKVTHTLEKNEALTLILIEPQTALARTLLDAVGASEITGLPDSVADQIDIHGSLGSCLEHLLRTLPRPAREIDARLQKAIDHLDAELEDGSLRSAAIASGLSESRLRALAVEQLTVPLSKWIIWRKIRQACQALARGSDLADAALAGGFADQAHFTRTMKQVIGITPAIAAGPLQ